MKAVWNYLKSLKLRDILILIVLLYIIFWYLEDQKATGLLGHLAHQGNQWMMWLLALDSPTSTVMVQQTSDIPRSHVQTFLLQPNLALLQLRNGFYDKPAGHYIRVDQQGHCRAKYSKKYQGYWLTPAEVLCPQVQALLAGQSLEPLTIPIDSGCERDQSDANRRGWACDS